MAELMQAVCELPWELAAIAQAMLNSYLFIHAIPAAASLGKCRHERGEDLSWKPRGRNAEASQASELSFLTTAYTG